MEYKLLDKSEVNSVWPHIQEWVSISRGVDKSFGVDDIKKLCSTGAYDLWIIRENGEYFGFLIGIIIPAPLMKLYYAPWLGGKDLARWAKQGLEAVKFYSKRHGCGAYSFIGRDAWMKLLDIKSDYQGTFYFINIED